jgi:phage terminase large subunit
VKVQATKVFEDINDSVNEGYRYIFLRGSTRSSKSISALQYVIIECLKTPKISVTIARATAVSLKNTILVDFKDIMESMDIWDKGTFNKVDNTFIFDNESIIRFVGVDDKTGRLRGLRSTIVLCDEVNTFDRNSFIQLELRCEKYLISCYNPEMPENHWIFDYEKKDNAVLHISSWRDNPFLDDKIIESIQQLKEIDYDMWLIYSESQIVPPREKIYQEPETYTELPPNIKEKYYGIDFGYSNDPCAVVEMNVDGRNIYVKQIVYDLGLTNEDLAYKLKDMGIDRDADIVCDSAEPKSIAELKRNGLNVRPVQKTSVLYGIQKVRQYKIFVHEDSVDILNEFDQYQFKKDRSGNITNTPTGADHALDAIKYGILQFLDKPKTQYSFL